MIHFSCPCGKSLSVRDEHAGETMRCLDCDRELTIPGVEGVETEAFSLEPGEQPLRQPRPGRDSLNEGPLATKTSGMAIASIVLGVASLFLCSVLSGLPAIILGGMGLGAIGRSRGRLTGKGLAITGIVTGGISVLLLPVIGIALLVPAVSRVRDAAARVNNANNLKQITLAMMDYNSAKGTFPPAAICDPNGKPLLSWRVAILPYVEYGALYNQFKLDEAWDGPHNSKLIAQMPKVYALPGDKTPTQGNTCYLVFVGNGAAFDLCKGARLEDFGDGLSQTILVAETDASVPWTKPEDLDFDPTGPAPILNGHFYGGAAVGMGDGSVRQIPKTVSPQTLKAAITRAAADVLGPDW